MTRRRLSSLAAVLFAVYLVVSVQPVGAATVDLAVVSEHTTNSDFNSATTLSNMIVSGGSVSLDDQETVNSGFEDGDISEWSGATGSFSTSTTHAHSGSYSVVKSSSSDEVIYITETDTTESTKVSAYMYMDSGISPSGGGGPVMADASDEYVGARWGANDDLRLIKYTSSGGTTIVAETNANFFSDQWQKVVLERSGNTYTAKAYDSSDNLIDSVSASISGISDNKAGIRLHDSGSTFIDDHVAILGSAADQGTYIGQAHQVDRAEIGRVDISSLTDANASVTWQGSTDGTTWNDAASQTYTTAGTKDLDISGTGYEYWRVNVTFQSTGSNTDAVLASESVHFNPAAPAADMANSSPVDGSTTNNETVTLSIPVSDPDFATSQGDQVTVDVVLDGATIHTTTISSNQTVEYTATGLANGSHSYHVELADDYGETVTSTTNSFTVLHYPAATDNASANPQGGQQFNAEDVTVSIDVTDRDFAEPSGDTVTVDFYVDGNLEDSKTITSNRTVSFDATNLSDDSHSWYVETQDEYGLTSSSDTFSFQVNHYAASPDNTSASPQGGQQFNDENITVSIDVTDPDFNEPSGDTVTVDFYVDGGLEASKILTSNGTVSFNATGLSDGSHTWHVETVDEYGLSSQSNTFTFDIQHYAPTFDNASASPQSGAGETTRQVTVSIPVEDIDFGETDGSSASIDFYLDGSQVNSTTITANQTVSATISVSSGGEHTWHAEATDEYGLTAQSATFSFRVPDELRIYNESSPTDLVKNATTELRFYFNERSDDPLIINRTATNGTVNLTGVPADEPFVVVADAPGYLPRRIYVESLFETQSIFLLPENETFVEPVFVLEDYSGQYPEEDTVLLVQRALTNASGATNWETVMGDRFGATGQFTSQLKYNTRHRLVILNTETGQRDVVGPYTPVQSGEFTVTVFSDGTIEVERFTTLVTFDPSVRTLPAVNTTPVTVSVDSQGTELSYWNVTVAYRNGSSSTTLATVNRTGPDGGEVTLDLALANRSGGNVTVLVEYETTAGKTGQEVEVFTIEQSFMNEHSLLATLADVPQLLPAGDRAAFKTFVAILASIFATGAVASTFRVPTETVGLVPVAVLSGFSVVGWVGYTLVFASGVAWVGLAGLRRAI